MHVGVFCSNYPPHPGGLEVVVQSVAAGLARAGHAVTLLASAWDGTAGVTQEDGVCVHRVPALHVTETWGVPYPVPRGPGLRRALRDLRSADVFHAHGALYASSVIASREASKLRRPLVLTEHVGFVRYRRRAINAVERVAWRVVGDRVVERTFAVATYNGRVREWLQGRHPGHTILHIGNGVDTVTFRPRPTTERAALRARFGLPERDTLVIFAGRDSEKKNLDAVLRIPRDRFTLVVCGARRGLEGSNLRDLGVVPHREMPELFGCTDLLVHASVGEGFPLAVQEGMAAGLPLVLLWDPGYAAGLSRDVVAACEHIDQLSERVHALVGDPAARAHLGERARAWAETQWSWDATVAAYEGLFRDAVASRPRPANV